jgi:hypothetical protein
MLAVDLDDVVNDVPVPLDCARAVIRSTDYISVRYVETPGSSGNEDVVFKSP